jgi:PAS domain S-box-containing protein
LQRRYRPALIAAVVAEATVAVSLVALIGALGILPYSMTIASEVLVLAAATPIVVISARQRLLPEEMSLGIGGILLLALATTLFIARATGTTDTTLDVFGAGPSLQMLLASIFIGTCYTSLVSTRGVMSGDSSRWLPIALCIAGFVTVSVLWRGLAARENEDVAALTRQAGAAQVRVLLREAEVSGHSLKRAAQWRTAGATLDEQRRDADALRSDIPGLGPVAWISALGVPDTSSSLGIDAASADSAALVYMRLKGQLPDTTAYLVLDSAARLMAIVAPACDSGPCAGAMVGTVRTTEFFSPLVPDIRQGFSYEILGPAGTLAASPDWPGDFTAWTQRLPFQFGAVRLTLATSPTLETVDRIRSNLPLLVLLMGFAVSGLLPISVLLGQQTFRGLREAERMRISKALERTTDGIWEWEIPTGGSVHSPGVWRHLGYDPAVVPPRRDAWLSLVHPEDLPRLTREIDDHLAGVRPSVDVEYRVLASDGTWHTIVDRGRVVDRTGQGRPLRMVGIKADVTTARAAQQALEAAEQRFRQVFDSGFQFQLLLDHVGSVIEVNQHALDECGVSVEQVLRRPVADTLWWTRNPEAQARLHEAVAAALRGSSRRYVDTFQGNAGSALNLEIAVKPLTGDKMAPTQLLLEARDISARTRAEATLREVETLTTMGRLAGQVAHEINNPLAGIQNSFLLIKGAIPPTHPHYSYVGAIEREIARIGVVTRQLYETYRPESEAAPTAVGPVLGDAVAFLAQVNRQSGVTVRIELGPSLHTLRLPAPLLRQIVYNLVQNAVEASPPNGIVTVRTAADDGHFELRVRDQGPGVPLDSREKIFESFYTTKSGRLRSGGMGLGLALVRRSVTAAGGTIEVRDVEGGGCDFVVTLPLTTDTEVR